MTKNAMCLPSVRPLPPAIETSRAPREASRRHDSLVALVRQPWLLRVRSGCVLLRPAEPRDLEAVAAMHARCSAQSLLDRYRSGGRGPSVPTMQRMLRRPMSFVVTTRRGTIVGLGAAAIDPYHSRESAEIGVIVEDGWQRMGLGRELTSHIAGAAAVSGYTELIAYAGTSIAASQRLLVEVGSTRIVNDPEYPHLHTHLSESAALGLGPVRERLAG
jgi:N-acetylglutamate synthase-like GNAT family acetyltransferase